MTHPLVEPLQAGPRQRTVGSALRRVTYHDWFHIGAILAVRQMLGHPRLPDYMGDIDGLAPHRPEGRD